MARQRRSTGELHERESDPFNPDQHELLCGERVVAKGGGNLGMSAALWQTDIFAGCEHGRLACPHIHTITTCLHGGADISQFIDGRQRYHGRSRPSFTALVKAGEAPRSICYSGRGQYLVFYLPDTLLQRSAADEFKQNVPFELLPHYYRHDPMIAQMGRLVAQEIDAPSSGSQMMLDSVSLALIVRMLRSWSNLSDRTDLHKAGLAAWQQKRAIEQLQSRYHDNLSIADLAAELRLSPFHFIRSFKRSVGVPPHQYLTQVRLERGRVLLETSLLSITEVAFQIGYESPAHFARLFRRHYGMTPTAYRRERKT